jgi:dTDP-4-dehydrorhamnose 3,5-epimerase
MAQGKLARVVKGSVLDVAVDCRLKSNTYGKYVSVVLSDENKRQFWIPRGFAHGFSVLSDDAIFVYKCDNFFSKECEIGIVFNDVDLKIDWQVKNPIVSEKDLLNLKFVDLKKLL